MLRARTISGVRRHRRAPFEQLANEYEAKGDDYNSILTKAIADRFAEACAEYLHEQVRRHYWGYAPDEAFSTRS